MTAHSTKGPAARPTAIVKGAAAVCASLVMLWNTLASAGQPAAPQLYASPATKAQLSDIADAIPRWAGMDVIVRTQADRQLYGQTFPSPGAAFDAVARNLGYSMPGPSLKASDRKALQKFELNALLTTLRAPETVAFNPSRAGAGSAHNTLCVIGLPAPGSVMTNQAAWTHMPRINRHFDFSPADFVRYAAEHETRHCTDPHLDDASSGEVAFETRADEHGIAFERGRTGDTPEFRRKTEEVIVLRVLESFDLLDATHATAPALSLTGNKPDYRLFAADAKKRGHPIPASPTRATVEIHSYAIESIFDKIIDYAAWRARTTSNDMIPRLYNDPSLIYRSVLDLNRRNAFRKFPLEQRYVDQYMAAYAFMQSDKPVSSLPPALFGSPAP